MTSENVIFEDVLGNAYCTKCNKSIANPNVTNDRNQYCFECNQYDTNCVKRLSTDNVRRNIEPITKVNNNIGGNDKYVEDIRDSTYIDNNNEFRGLKEEIRRQDSNPSSKENFFFHSQLMLETMNDWKKDFDNLGKMKQRRDIHQKVLKEINERSKIFIIDLKLQVKLLRDIRIKTLEESSKLLINKEEKKSTNTKLNELKDIALTNKSSFTINDSEINDLKRRTTFLTKEIEKVNILLRKLKLIHDFVWTIDNYSKRKMQSYESDTFYKDKYKAHLRVSFKGFHLKLYLSIAVEHQDLPLKYDVLLSILNKNTLHAHASSTFKYEYHPINIYGPEKSLRKKDEIGPLIISYLNLAHTHGLICGDAITVSCVLIKSDN